MRNNETCYSQWFNYRKDTYQDVAGQFVDEYIKSWFNVNVTNVFIGAHLPLGNGDTVDILFVVEQTDVGGVSLSRFTHVKPQKAYMDKQKESQMLTVLTCVLCVLMSLQFSSQALEPIAKKIVRKCIAEGDMERELSRIFLVATGVGLGFCLWYIVTCYTTTSLFEMPLEARQAQTLYGVAVLGLSWCCVTFIQEFEELLEKRMACE